MADTQADAAPAPKTRTLLAVLFLALLIAAGVVAYYWSTAPSAPEKARSPLARDGRLSGTPSPVSPPPEISGQISERRRQPPPASGIPVLSPPIRTAPEIPPPPPVVGSAPETAPSPLTREESPPAGNGAHSGLPQQTGTPDGTARTNATHGQEGREAALPAREGEPSSEMPPQAEEPQTPSVIVYDKGKPLSPEGHIAGGDIDAASPPLDAGRLYGPSASRAPSAKPVSARGEDSVVGMGFINDLAAFLAANYWPAGTHPMARRRGITTADVQWANLKFGRHLQGFNVPRTDARAGRERVLRYVLMPSMINGLNRLYSERFIATLRREALAQKRDSGNGPRPLTLAEQADMYRIYATQARRIAGALEAYLNTPDMRDRVERLRAAEEAAAQAGALHIEHRHSGPASQRAALASEYRQALRRREQARDTIAAAMRRGGETQGMDTESLVYMAMWLSRRTPDSTPALSALAAALTECAGRLDEEKNRLTHTAN